MFWKMAPRLALLLLMVKDLRQLSERDEANGKSQECMVTINLDASVAQLLDTSYPPSNEGKN